MIEVLRFDSNEDMSKKSLKGILTILVNGKEVRSGIKIFDNGKSKWVGFPSYKQVNDEGKEVYVPYCHYREPDVQKKYCLEILKAYDGYR